MKQSKPMFIALFLMVAATLSGCGKNNNGSAVVPPGGIVNGQINPGYPNGGTVALSGVIATYAGQVYMDSANIMTSYGPSQVCPGTENFSAQPLTGSGSDGVIAIYGIRTSCYANVQVQIQLSQLVVQDILYKLGPYGNGTITAQIVQINVGRYGNTVYGGGLGGGRAARLLINGTMSYYVYF